MKTKMLVVIAFSYFVLAGCQQQTTPVKVTEVTRVTEVTKTFKQKVLAITWEDVWDDQKRSQFVKESAQKYVELTGTSNFTAEKLVSMLSFYKTRDEYLSAIREGEPEYNANATQWGYSQYATHKTFIDLETLKQVVEAQNYGKNVAGLALLDGLWHEWLHQDVGEEKVPDQLKIDKVPTACFTPPGSSLCEPFERYRGGEIYTQNWFGFSWSNEILVETIIIRMISEGLDLEEVVSAGDYYQYGTEVLWPYSKKIGPWQKLYSLYTSSSFEELAQVLGDSLPGEAKSLTKGIGLMTAIHQADPDLIEQTGVYQIIGGGQEQ